MHIGILIQIQLTMVQTRETHIHIREIIILMVTLTDTVIRVTLIHMVVTLTQQLLIRVVQGVPVEQPQMDITLVEEQ